MVSKIPHYKYILVVVTVTLILGYLVLSSATEQRFHRLSDEYLEWYFQTNPVKAMQLGVHRYDDRLSDYQPHDVTECLEDLLIFRSKFESLNQSDMDLNDAIDCQLILDAISRQVFELSELEEWTWNPLVYTTEIQQGLEGIMRENYPLVDQRVKNLSARLAAIPEYLETAQDLLALVPFIHLENAIEHCSGLEILLTDEIDLFELKLDNAGRELVRRNQPAAMAAVREFQLFLEYDLARRPEKDFRLGRELYQLKFQHDINEGVSVEDVKSRALTQLKLVQAEMFDLARPLYRKYFHEEPGMAPHQERMEVVRRVLDFLGTEETIPGEIFAVVQLKLAELENFVIGSNILAIDPAISLKVRPTPYYYNSSNLVEFEAAGYFARSPEGILNVADITGHGPGFDLASYLREYNRFSLEILLIHEAIPGHFIQYGYSRRHPSQVRAVFASPTMTEGWAHYCESMMVECGYRAYSPEFVLFEKKWKLRGIVNALIDIGVQAENMSEEEAVNLLTTEAFQEPAEAELKWKRAQLTSTQLCTYFIGYMRIMDLRQDMLDVLGVDFLLGDFHNTFLAAGPMPVRYIRSLLLNQ